MVSLWGIQILYCKIFDRHNVFSPIGVVTVFQSIGIKEDVSRRCQAAPTRIVRVSADTGHPHVRWYAVTQQTPGFLQSAVVCCTSRLISDVRRQHSTRLFAVCRCLHELGWPSFDTYHSRQSGCSFAPLLIDQNTETTPQYENLVNHGMNEKMKIGTKNK